MEPIQTVMVCGVAGVGKTTLIRSSLEQWPETAVYDAHDLAVQAAEVSDSTGLAISAAHRVARHFQLLARGFSAERSKMERGVIILECHSTVDSGAGWFDAPLHVFKAIAPVALVHVEDECERIAKRCLRDRSAVRLTRSVIELARYQDRSLRACERHAAHLGCSVHRVRADAADEFRDLIRAIKAGRTPPRE